MAISRSTQQPSECQLARKANVLFYKRKIIRRNIFYLSAFFILCGFDRFSSVLVGRYWFLGACVRLCAVVVERALFKRCANKAIYFVIDRLKINIINFDISLNIIWWMNVVTTHTFTWYGTTFCRDHFWLKLISYPLRSE